MNISICLGDSKKISNTEEIINKNGALMSGPLFEESRREVLEVREDQVACHVLLSFSLQISRLPDSTSIPCSFAQIVRFLWFGLRAYIVGSCTFQVQVKLTQTCIFIP